MKNLFPSLCLGLALAATATAQQTVTLYFDSSYGGPSLTLPLPVHPGLPLVFPSAFDDQVTSIRWNLQPNTVVYLYENGNLSGREYCVTHDRPRIGGTTNVGSYYNDKLSSLRWASVDPSEGWARFYTNTNRGGYQLTRYLSLVSGAEIPLIQLGYNDQVDSVEWNLPADKTLMCHDEYPAGGKALALIDSGYYANLDSGLFGHYHDNLSTVLVFDGQLTSVYADRNRPIDRVCQLGSHNSHVNYDQGWVFWVQQNWSILKQLDYGVRSINIDVREENGQFLLVHGSVAQSQWARAGAYPLPVDAELHAIRSWLLAHPSEVIFLQIQNDAGQPFTTWLDGHPLASMFYFPTQMHWPSINELVALGKRVIVTNKVPSGIQIYPWTWTVENGYSDLWDTEPRSESADIDGRQRSLFMMNNISGTSTVSSWLGNSPNDAGPLLAHAYSFVQVPNLVQIDGVDMADHAGLEVCRKLNLTRWALPPKATAYRFWDSCGASELFNTTTPRLGSSYQLQGGAWHALVVGFSDESAGGAALPTTVPGITYCSLRTSLDLLSAADGLGRSSIAIPPANVLLGAEMFCQAAEFGGATWNLSNGIAARLGL